LSFVECPIIHEVIRRPTVSTASNTPPPSVPPPSYNAPNVPFAAAPPVYAPPGVGGYPNAPLSNQQVVQPPPSAKPNVQFFSTGSGVPVQSQAFTPPPSNFGSPYAPPVGGSVPPPSGSGPIGAPLMMPPPPTGAAFVPPGGVPLAAPTPQYSLQYGATAVPASNSMVGMPSGFDSGTNLAAQAQSAQNPGGTGGPTHRSDHPSHQCGCTSSKEEEPFGHR